MDTALEIKNISKSFAINFGAKGRAFGHEYKNVINELSISLERGMVTSLVGGNGVGKTTLFNIISGLLRADDGSILYHHSGNTIDCTRAAPWKIASSGVGRMFQGARVYSDLSVIDHLLIQARPASSESPFYNVFHPLMNRKSDRNLNEMIYEELKEFAEFRDLWAVGAKPASSLSFAGQRMLSLAGILVGHYELLLLDEPSSGLNPESFETMFRFLDLMRARGKTVFLIEHNMKFISKLTDYCHYMAEGTIRFSGTPEEVLNHAEVKQSYLL